MPRLHLAENDVSGSDLGDAGLDRPDKADIAAVDEGFEGFAAGLVLDGVASQKAFLHHVVAFVGEELPQIAILEPCPVFFIFFRCIAVGRDDIMFSVAVYGDLFGVVPG